MTPEFERAWRRLREQARSHSLTEFHQWECSSNVGAGLLAKRPAATTQDYSDAQPPNPAEPIMTPDPSEKPTTDPTDHLRFHRPHAHLATTFGNDTFALRAEAFARFFGTPTFLGAQSDADAQHREDLARANTERQAQAAQNTAQLLELLEQNTRLTEMTKSLTERIESLTSEMHDHMRQSAQR